MRAISYPRGRRDVSLNTRSLVNAAKEEKQNENKKKLAEPFFIVLHMAIKQYIELYKKKKER